ncbi:MAG: hypothetical protein GTO45_12955 [Candidatus Aminicenantes bacterium]|nr:hypothetical protein [Candidatus Aminicenantes bacterium]NIM79694.1 hypothetical protein [Candidatus Aminicenantes bacterium]NIN19020.1 hypothetical protein [Candidatus Aminicenantes bacterium]NIN42922.1 hypothetical protein [Candidatus Aminicenantes bacterium]NIN85659.1 hypothetical protein [Candidatus Aminicenantes bacterium]
MSVMSLSQIEKNVSMLPREEQLLLLERIIHRLRRRDMNEESAIEKEVTAMASDMEIQTELGEIAEEFSITEMDGLEKL